MDTSFENFENRKKDHIRLALSEKSQALVKSGFSKIKLNHLALPEFDFAEVSLQTKLLGHDFSSPHFVSSMTAGHENSYPINLNLARAAKHNNWLMAVGSQRRELTDAHATNEWKKIKAEVPQLKLISNIGILELLTHSPAQILRLADNLEAVGLFVHLNPLQEVFQDNGQVNFTGGLKALEKLILKGSL